MNEISSSIQKPCLDVRNIARNLLHPLTVRLLNNTGHFNFAGLQVDDEEYEVADQSGAGEYLNAKEVGRRNSTPMCLQKRAPRHALATKRGGIDAVVEQDPFNRAPANHMTKVIECAADPRVTPARVIAGYVQDQFFNLGGSFGATWFSRGAAIVLFGDELSVLSKQSIRRDDSPKCEESHSADYLGLACQTSTLAVSK